METDSLLQSVDIPEHIATCPECGPPVFAEFYEWATETGKPIVESSDISCCADLDFEHNYYQCDWQSVFDTVHAYLSDVFRSWVDPDVES